METADVPVCANAVDAQQNTVEGLPNAAVYYYCYHGRGHDETPHFLHWLLNQLCRQADYIPPKVVNLFQFDCQPQTDDLLEAIVTTGARFSRVFVSVDAVDESQKRESLAQMLYKMATKPEFSGFHILVTSRKEVDIESHLKEFFTLPMANELVGQDIARYIDTKLASERVFQRWSSGLRQDVKNTLTKKANGM